MEKFVVSHSPFIHSGNDINKMFLYVALALMIPAIYGAMFFGLTSLILIAVSVATCFVSESLFNLITKKRFMVEDFSFFVTGLILALTMPINMPWHFVLVGAFVASFITKMAFGGLGRNKFNPALVGRCLVGVISSKVAADFYSVVINGETLISLSIGGSNTLTNLIAGESVGGIGTTCIVIILICYVFLVYSGVIDFKIPLLAVIGYLITGLAMGGLEQTVMNMFSGSFMFVAVFMMTDPNTSPDSFTGKVVYSLMFGVLSALVWSTGKLAENSIFAVALFMNMLVPVMDRYLVWRPWSLGGVRNASKN